METLWFYLEEGQRQGPLTLDELAEALAAAPEPRGVRVWREGLADWQEAGSVPELSQRLPPSVPSFQRREDPGIAVPVEQAEAIAQLYRRLVLLVGAQLLAGFAIQALPTNGASVISGLLGLVLLPVVIVLTVMLIVTAYKLAERLDAGIPILWAFAMLVPCINIITLLVLSSKAQAWCRQYGIKVGLLGPTKESLEELRRRVVTSPFD